MNVSGLGRFVRRHFGSCLVLLVLVLQCGLGPVVAKSDLRTKLLLQNIRTHLAQKVEEVIQQKECESGLVMCQRVQTNDEKSEEVPVSPKFTRTHQKPAIKVNPKNVIQSMLPKVHKNVVKKPHKPFATVEKLTPNPFAHVSDKKASEESEESKESDPGTKAQTKLDETKAEKPKQKSQPATKAKPKEEPKEDKTGDSKKKAKVPTVEVTQEKGKKVKREDVVVNKKKEDVVNTKKDVADKDKAVDKNKDKQKSSVKQVKSTKTDKAVGKVGRADVGPTADDDTDDLVLPTGAFFFAMDSNQVNPETDLCRKHKNIYLRQLKKQKMWALMMYDASAKLPSGVLQGNLNQFGDYDECLAINAVFKKPSSDEPSGIRGKYCLANIDLSRVSTNGSLHQALERAKSFSFVKSTIYDPGHFIPRFSSINWGLCVPDTCRADDVKKMVDSQLRSINATTHFVIDVNIDEDNCSVKREMQFPRETAALLTLLLYVLVAVTTLYGTYLDVKSGKALSNVEKTDQGFMTDTVTATGEALTPDQPKGKFESFLLAFSLKRNLRKLLMDDQSGDNIGCINGIKSIFSVMLYVAHKTIPLGWTSFSNRILLTKMSNTAGSILLRISLVYTDSFLLMSGLLTSYNLSKEISVRGSISWPRKTAARFIRLTPALLAVLLFYAYVWNELGSGPLWSSLVKKNSDLCQVHMWRNLLYIQNLFAFENMCAPQTHQLALDMQLSLLSPIFVKLLYRNDKLGLGILQALFLLSSILRYHSTAANDLSVVVYHGMPVTQLYRTADKLYGQSIYRASPYLMGTIAGYYLQKYKGRIHVSRVLGGLGWLTALSLAFYSIVSPSEMRLRGYTYDPTEAAQYAALSPVTWSLALTWVIVACHLGVGGHLNRFLCNRALQVFSRISYAFYLTQFLVFFYKVGVKRIPEMFSLSTSLDPTEFFTVVAISTVVTLLFDIPMTDIRKLLLDRKAPHSGSESKEHKLETNQESPANEMENEADVRVEDPGDNLEHPERDEISYGNEKYDEDEGGSEEEMGESDVEERGDYEYDEDDLSGRYEEDEDEDAGDDENEEGIDANDDNDDDELFVTRFGRKNILMKNDDPSSQWLKIDDDDVDDVDDDVDYDRELKS